MTPLETRLQQALVDPESGWHMGSFGAIAEFHHVAGEPPPVPGSPLCQSTHRGGIRINRLEGVRPVAHESMSRRRDRWNQGVDLCLPRAEATMNQRYVLTEIGPDEQALRETDRQAVLFDMGLEQLQVDFCIRTADPELIATLRAAQGRSLMAPDNPAMSAILAAHPHRVALTRLGRVEVYQLIGGPDTGGEAPEGPHTHVLPKLLASGRTHSANTPIPEGWVPCAGWHPASPVSDRLGADKPFDPEAFDAFQVLLRDWGPADYVQAKDAAWEALDAGESPTAHPGASTRLGRSGLRNAIRQARCRHGDTPLLKQWSNAFDDAG